MFTLSTISHIFHPPHPFNSIPFYPLHPLHVYYYCINTGSVSWTLVRRNPACQAGARQGPTVSSSRSENIYWFVIVLAIGEDLYRALFGVPEVVAGRVMARSFRLGVTKTDPGWVAP